jgi:hypothetical protein
VLDSGELESCWHDRQLCAPVNEVCVFTGHFKQVCKFLNAVYVPGRQKAHGPLSGPLAPALQVQYELDSGELERAVQGAQAVAPSAGAYVFAAQDEHSAELATAAYLPGVHKTHGPPLGPRAPALQLQVVLPAGEPEYDGQFAQAVAAVAVEYVFATHKVQAVAFTTTAYVPGPHALQVAPSPKIL